MTTPPPLPQIPPASLAAFDKWLNQGNSSGCNESMWKAWQAALATQQKVVAIPEPSDDEVDLLLAEIDQIARNYDHHDYGLPTHADDSVASMRAQVQWFFESWTRHPQPLAGQQDRGEAENIREGAPYDNPKFEALCREHGIWGTPQAALCAVFWRAAPSGGDAAAQGAAREPLTEERIQEICFKQPESPAGLSQVVALVRAIEAAHGITTQGVDHD